MTKLAVEQKEKIESFIEDFNEEAKIITEQYKADLEKYKEDDSISYEDFQKLENELYNSYRNKIDKKVEVLILDRVIEMFKIYCWFSQGFGIWNLLFTYSVETDDINFKVFVDEDEDNKVVEYELEVK